MHHHHQKVLRIYADGVFDCFHLGHANMLKQAREAFPGQNVYLIAGVCKQVDIEKFKGPTINTQKQRFDLVKACKWVDEVVQGPWIITQQFLDQHRIDYVCHDDIPYVTADTDDAYALCKRLGKFKATKRTEGISTSDLVTRVIADRDKYILRNLKRGTTRKQLKLTLLEQLIIKFRSSPQDRSNILITGTFGLIGGWILNSVKCQIME